MIKVIIYKLLKNAVVRKNLNRTGWKIIKIGDFSIETKHLDIKFLKDRTKITSSSITQLSYKISNLQDQVIKLTLEKY